MFAKLPTTPFVLHDKMSHTVLRAMLREVNVVMAISLQRPFTVNTYQWQAYDVIGGGLEVSNLTTVAIDQNVKQNLPDKY